MKTTPLPIRFAVIGARRGRTFIKAAQALDAGIELAAVCDTSASTLEEWKGEAGLQLYSDFEQVLNDSKIDAVCIATPVPLHAGQAIAALNAGKHVLSEVTAAYTLKECRELIAAVERNGRTYMMAENFCFSDPVLQVQNMVEQGVFGDLSYASGSYLHDCRELFLTDEGELTWRGKLQVDLIANSYPTHSLGPVARWLGINHTDFFKTTATWQSVSQAMNHYSKRNYPDRPEYAAAGFWKHPDTVTTVIRTEKGRLIDLHLDYRSARPHNMTRYELQGTKASFSWPDGPMAEPLIWIEDRSPTNERGLATEWELLSKYREEFEHPLWRKHRTQAEKTDHGGGDYFILLEFASAIHENRQPLIDVYDAVTWSSITPLSVESIAKGNTSVDVPNFKAESMR